MFASHHTAYIPNKTIHLLETIVIHSFYLSTMSEAAKSNKDLFGDEDSSSSDEDVTMKDTEAKEAESNNPEKPSVAAAAPKAASNKDLFGDESSDDDDDDEQDKGGGEKKKAPPNSQENAEKAATSDNKATTKKSSDLFDDSDDSDDDEQGADFDDVVGLKSTTLAGVKTAPPPAASNERTGLFGASDDDEDNQSGGPDDPMEMDDPKDVAPKEGKPLVVPKTTKPASDVSMHITKLPNLIGFKTSAFDPDDYHPTIEEEDFGPSTVHNLVRWRYQKDDTGHLVRDEHDKLQRESNTRLVEWEDGSWTLHIGSEVFQVDSKDNSTPDGFPGLNGYMYLSQPATVDEEAGPESAGTVLECMGGIASRLTARPSSLQSEAHKSLTVAVRQKTIKKARIAEHVTQEDPEKLKQERIRAKSDVEKNQAAKKRNSSGSTRRPRMSRGYLEEDEGDYDDFDIRAEKRRMYDDGVDYDDGEDEDLEADDTFNASRPTKKARSSKESKEESEDEEELGAPDDDESEEEETFAARRRADAAKKKPSHRAVFEDDSDSDSD